MNLQKNKSKKECDRKMRTPNGNCWPLLRSDWDVEGCSGGIEKTVLTELKENCRKEGQRLPARESPLESGKGGALWGKNVG